MKKIGKTIDGHFLQEIKRGYYVRLWIPYPAGLYEGPGFWTVARITSVNGDGNPNIKAFYENQMSGVFTTKGWGRNATLVARKKSQLSAKDLLAYNDGRKATDWRRLSKKDGGTAAWERTWDHNYPL